MSRFLILLAFLVTSIPSICFASDNTSSVKLELNSVVVQIYNTLKLSRSEQAAELDRLNEELDRLFKQSDVSNSKEQENFLDAYTFLSSTQKRASSGEDEIDPNMVFVEVTAEEMAAANS